MKVYEYLAAGLRVVSTALPSLERTASDDVVLTEGDSFLHAVQSGFETWSEQAAERRRALARGHSWQARGEQALTLLHGLFTDDRPAHFAVLGPCGRFALPRSSIRQRLTIFWGSRPAAGRP